jgi:hypothetical protein
MIAIKEKRHEISVWDNVINIVVILLIIFEILYYRKINVGIKILGDEFGYWAAGNFFSGINNWKEMNSVLAYYGYGYGLFLAIIMRFVESGELCYRIAIWMNGLFIFLTYHTVKSLIKEFRGSNYRDYDSLIAACFTFMTANLYYLQYTMVEVVVSFLLWRVIFWAVQLQKSIKIYKTVIFCGYNFLLVAAHQRCIGIVLCSMAFLFFLFCSTLDRFSLKLIVINIMIVVMTIVIFLGLKKFYKLNSVDIDVINNYGNTISDPNDVSGVAGKVKFLFTRQGIINFGTLLCGHMFYAMSASFLTIGVAIIAGMREIIISVKRKKINDFQVIMLYTFMCFLLEISIACIFFIYDYNERFDLLTYSRYFEFAISPITMFGMIAFINIDENSRNSHLKTRIVVICFVVYIILGKFTNFVEDYSNANRGNSFIQSYWIRFFMLKTAYRQYFFIEIILVTVAISVILFYLMKKHYFGVIAVFLCCMYLYAANYVYNNIAAIWVEKNAQELNEVDNLLTEGEKNVYTLNDDHLWVYELQQRLNRKTINVINSYEDLGDEDVLVLSANGDYGELIDSDELDKIYIGEYFIVLKYAN